MRFATGLLAALALTAAVETGHGDEPPATGTATPSVEEVCKTRLDQDKAIGALGAALEAFKKLQDEVQQASAAAPPAPIAPPPGQAAAPAQPPATATTIFRQAEQATANMGTVIAQAGEFQARAAAKMAQASRETDAARRATLYKQASEDFDKRDGLIQGVTARVQAALGERAQERAMARLHIGDSPALRQLIRLESKAKELDDTGRVVAAEAAYANAAAHAVQTINRVPQTRFFEVPSPVVQPGTPAKEPGGIKFSSSRAAELARALDITSIEFDPARGSIMLAGTKSSQTFDLEVFADVLRLAAEVHEPFFSLDDSDPKEAQEVLARSGELLRKKYPSVRQVAQRIRALSPAPVRHGGRDYYYTTLDAFDPEIVKSAGRGRDFTTKLVFSPAWLRHSKVGQILYEADLAIKGVAGGFVDHDGALTPALVWDLPGFDPMWLQREDRARAGRANFVLARSSVTYRGANRLDLSEVRPELYVTERRPGTNEDLKPSERDSKVSAHFDQNWQAYVARVPEIARLHMVYRAYVAARFLADQHPGLAERIQKMPRSLPPEQPPLRIIMPTVMHAWDADGEAGYDMSIGYGGGIAFELESKPGEKEPRVRTVMAQVEPNDWLGGLLAAASYEGGAWEDRAGGRAAALLEFDSDGLPASWHARLALALGALMLAAAGLGLFLHRYDWQQLATAHTCAHCARVHDRLGRAALFADILAAGSVAYIAMLPLAAAAHDQKFSAAQPLLATAVLLGLSLALALLGGIWQSVFEPPREGALRGKGAVPALFTGARLACVLLALFLFHAGFSAGALGRSLSQLMTAHVAERVLGVLGGVAPIAWAVSLGLAAAASSFALRWLGPRLFNSRPLPRYSFSPEQHSHPEKTA